MTRDDVRIAIIVEPSLPLGLLANTVATIAIGLGAAHPPFGGTALTDALGRRVMNSADRPVPILQAPCEAIGSLLIRGLPAPEGGIVVPFPRFARGLHAFTDYQLEFPTRDLAREALDGLGIAGPGRWVKSLTGNLRLLR